MVGLDVMPSKPSSTRSCSLPDVSSLRLMLSYQMLWPSFASSRTRLVVMQVSGSGSCRAALDGEHFVQAPEVPLFAAEARADERRHQLARQLDADDARAQAQHVHIVVLDALAGRVRIVA